MKPYKYLTRAVFLSQFEFSNTSIFALIIPITIINTSTPKYRIFINAPIPFIIFSFILVRLFYSPLLYVAYYMLHIIRPTYNWVKVCLNLLSLHSQTGFEQFSQPSRQLFSQGQSEELSNSTFSNDKCSNSHDFTIDTLRFQPNAICQTSCIVGTFQNTFQQARLTSFSASISQFRVS